MDAILTLIKYSFLHLCAFYFYRKLLNLKRRTWSTWMDVVFSVALAAFVCAAKRYFPFIALFATVGIFAAVLKALYKLQWKQTVFVSVLSYGLSYVFLYISLVVGTPLLLLSSHFLRFAENLLSFILVGTIQLLLATIPFRLRKLKSGLPFLYKPTVADLGFWLALLVLAASSVLSTRPPSDVQQTIYLAAIVLAGVILAIWCSKVLRQKYVQSLRQRQIDDMQDQLDTVTAENERLSKIIHKDNKLVAAMESAAQTMLTSTGDSQLEQAEQLSRELSALRQERQNILQSETADAQAPAKTGVVRVDVMLQYLSMRAAAQDTVFRFLENASVQHMTQQVIPEDDLTTLIADLVENALIAVKKSEQRQVLLRIRTENSAYVLDVYDSGEMFAPEVLEKLGKERITTHADEGGSGIGLMTCMELIRKYRASFLLDENMDNTVYSKRLSVCFDGQERLVLSPRVKEEAAALT